MIDLIGWIYCCSEVRYYPVMQVDNKLVVLGNYDRTSYDGEPFYRTKESALECMSCKWLLFPSPSDNKSTEGIL